MSAQVHEEELHAFLDGQLPRWRCTAVLMYLGRHPHETERLEAYALHKEQLRHRVEEPSLQSGDPTTAMLERALAHRLTGPSYRDWLRRAAAMAALLATGWWGNTLYQRHVADRLPGVVVEAAQAHEIFGGDPSRPVELTAAAAVDMAAWFSSRLGELVEVPSLQALGLRLVGGRLLAGDDGPVAQMIYEDRSGYRVTLCLSSAPDDGGPEIEVVTLEGLIAGYWHEGELTYALVGDTSEQELVAIATWLGTDQPEGWI
jgi:anti-sigma factor RsiW